MVTSRSASATTHAVAWGIAIAGALSAGAEPTPLAQSAPVPAPAPVRWSGSATGESRRTGTGAYILPALGTEPGGAASQTGDVVATWKATLKLKEVESVNVTGASGAVVGRFVRLIDDGSTVTMSMSGRMTEKSPYGDIEHWDYSGDNVPADPKLPDGTRGMFQQGWVYYSLTSPDPLADILPNGTYSLQGQPFVLDGFIVKVTNIDAGHADQPHSHQMKTGGTGALMAGYAYWAWAALTPAQRIARGMGDGTSLTVDLVRSALTGTSAMMRGVTADDPKSYAVHDGVMQGRMSTIPQTEPGERVSQTNTWRLERRTEISASLARVSRNWRPLRDGLVTVVASVDPALNTTGKFRFTLLDVSREKGFAINAGDGTDPDLAFQTNQAGFGAPTAVSGGWQIESTGTAARMPITIVTHDYGAYARLKAEVNVDGQWYDCAAEGGGTSVTLPRDDNGNHIADSWEDIWVSTGSQATDDVDDQPGPSGTAQATRRQGDGLSLYEEYRGFMRSGQWDIGYPGQKDVFVHDALGLGVGVFGATGLRIHLINDDEYDARRVINFNRGYGTKGPQKGLHLMDRPLAAGIAGMVSPVVGTPNVVDWVGIDSSKDTFLGFGRYFDSLVAHELGHAVNIPHHGDLPATNHICAGDPMYIAVRGGTYSGTWECVMRYNDATSYEGWDGKCYAAPDDGVTFNFCRTRAGTNLNAGPNRVENGVALPMAGDATNGECWGRVTIRGVAKHGG